jgi:predicted enzyme related to lactoylglutathione lyase
MRWSLSPAFCATRWAQTAPFTPPEVIAPKASADKAWMVNFRVRSLDPIAAQLRAAGVSVEVDAQSYPNGRFARLYDTEDNPIELWEPDARDAS